MVFVSHEVPFPATSAQASGDVSNRSEIQMKIWYHGRVPTYSEYQKTTIRKYLTEGYVRK